MDAVPALHPVSGKSDSFIFDSDTKIFSSGATPVIASTQYSDYGFIAFLGLAQRLKIGFLPLTWQVKLGRIGKGGQAGINQALVNLQASFAFKRFNYDDGFQYREILQELVVLGHPAVRNHPHIIKLEGICWDVVDDHRVYPVLVYRKTHLGDLRQFAKLDRFKRLTVGDKVSLCVNVAVAVRDMHHNGIIHGDIKPENTLVFEENSQIIARVADFGFATCFQGQDDWVMMPKSEPWNAPEHHGRQFTTNEAKKMDVYSFGLMCLWLLFRAGSDNVSLLPEGTYRAGLFVDFEESWSDKNLLLPWKWDPQDKLVDWACWLVRNRRPFDDAMNDKLQQFFQLTLNRDQSSRSDDWGRLLLLLSPARVDSEMEAIHITFAPNEEYFEIASSIDRFYDSDFRLRKLIVKDLKSTASHRTSETKERISPKEAALQLALALTIGFGDIRKNDFEVTMLMKEHSFTFEDLRSRIQLIETWNYESPSNEGLYQDLWEAGYLRSATSLHYYDSDKLLKFAEIVHRNETREIQLSFSRTHHLCLAHKSRLAWIFIDQERWKLAEELLLELKDAFTLALGDENPVTLTRCSDLAVVFWRQGRFQESLELEQKILEARKRAYGSDDPRTNSAMAELAITYCSLGRWDEAEESQMQALKTSITLLGDDHPDCLSSRASLVEIYNAQGRYDEAQELSVNVIEGRSKVLGAEHPHTLMAKANLSSTYRHEGRLGDAAELDAYLVKTSTKVLGSKHQHTLTFSSNLAATCNELGLFDQAYRINIHVLGTRLEVLGVEHPDTATSMSNLAWTYWSQQRFADAETFWEQASQIFAKVLGDEHPKTLDSIANLAAAYGRLSRKHDAEKLESQVLEARSRILGAEHPYTLTSMANMAYRYWDLERHSQALDVAKKAVELRGKVFGLNHSITVATRDKVVAWEEEIDKEVRSAK